MYITYIGTSDVERKDGVDVAHHVPNELGPLEVEVVEDRGYLHVVDEDPEAAERGHGVGLARHSISGEHDEEDEHHGQHWEEAAEGRALVAAGG